MVFWNFIHNILGMHVYVFLMFVLAAVMVVIAIVHTIKTKNREKENSKAIEEFSGTPAQSAETKSSQEANKK